LQGCGVEGNNRCSNRLFFEKAKGRRLFSPVFSSWIFEEWSAFLLVHDQYKSGFLSEAELL